MTTRALIERPVTRAAHLPPRKRITKSNSRPAKNGERCTNCVTPKQVLETEYGFWNAHIQCLFQRNGFFAKSTQAFGVPVGNFHFLKLIRTTRGLRTCLKMKTCLVSAPNYSLFCEGKPTGFRNTRHATCDFETRTSKRVCEFGVRLVRMWSSKVYCENPFRWKRH